MSRASYGSAPGRTTLAQTITFTICEAIQRFSERAQPVVAKFVSNKPRSYMPTVKPQDLDESFARNIDKFSYVSGELASIKQTSKERKQTLKTKEDAARTKLSRALSAYPERQARVELERAAPIPSTVRSLAYPEDVEDARMETERFDARMETERFDDGASSAEESESYASEESIVIEEGDVHMLDDNHSVKTASKFVVGQKPVKRINPDVKPLSYIQLRGIVLGACCKILAYMQIDPNQSPRQQTVRQLLVNMEFWERVLTMVKRNVEHADTMRKIEDMTVYIKEERRRPQTSDKEGTSFLLGLIRYAQQAPRPGAKK